MIASGLCHLSSCSIFGSRPWQCSPHTPKIGQPSPSQSIAQCGLNHHRAHAELIIKITSSPYTSRYQRHQPALPTHPSCPTNCKHFNCPITKKDAVASHPQHLLLTPARAQAPSMQTGCTRRLCLYRARRGHPKAATQEVAHHECCRPKKKAVQYKKHLRCCCQRPASKSPPAHENHISPVRTIVIERQECGPRQVPCMTPVGWVESSSPA